MSSSRQSGRRQSRAPRSTGISRDSQQQTTNIILQDSHHQGIRETEDHFKAKRTVKEHNTRLKEMIKWVKEEYPGYYTDGVVELSDEQKSDTSRYHTSTHDFAYANMNIDVLKAFMSHKKFHPPKTTADGRPIHMSFSHMRKYYDAILFGAYRANVPLPATFKIEMGSYIDSIKKEKIKARKKENLMIEMLTQ